MVPLEQEADFNSMVITLSVTVNRKCKEAPEGTLDTDEHPWLSYSIHVDTDCAGLSPDSKEREQHELAPGTLSRSAAGISSLDRRVYFR